MGKKVWWGNKLKNLQADYGNPGIPMVEVARKHGTTLGNIDRLAKIHGWPRRRLTQTGKMSGLKLRRWVLARRVQKYQREISQIDQKIKFMENLNG